MMKTIHNSEIKDKYEFVMLIKRFLVRFHQVETNEVVGRHLVATKDIPQGQLILNESPFVCGPRQLSKPVCLGCHKELKDASSVVKCSRY